MNTLLKQRIDEIHMILGPEWILESFNDIKNISFTYKSILSYEIIFSKQLLEFRLIEICNLCFVKNIKKNNDKIEIEIDVEICENYGYILK